MMDAQSVRKQFELYARSGPQLELRLYWFARALAVRSGYIVAVERSRLAGRHMASIAYEVPLPAYAKLRKRNGALQVTAGGPRRAAAWMFEDEETFVRERAS